MPEDRDRERELPRYKCHKEVWALKIQAIESADPPEQESDGSALIVPADEGCGKRKVSAEYMRKHKPQPGGYWVRYADGYESYSPAKAFEEGYTKV